MHHSLERLRRSRSESGYALIGALWFLLLAASIVAVLMARATNAASAVAEERRTLTDRYALESAVETALADIVMNGPASFAIRSPAELDVTIGRRTIRVAASSEAGRADANSAEPDAVDARLREAGIEPGIRARVVAAIIERRRTGLPVGSLAELQALLGQVDMVQGEDAPCLLEHLTVSTSLTRPVADFSGGGVTLSAAYPLRLVAFDGEAPGLVAIVRIGGRLDQAVQVVDRIQSWQCRG